MTRIDSNNWYFSPDHGQLCQVIESQTLWGGTTCRVWLPGSDSVVRISAANLKPLADAATGTPAGITYVAAAARVADALTQDVMLSAYRILGYPASSSDQGAVPGGFKEQRPHRNYHHWHQVSLNVYRNGRREYALTWISSGYPGKNVVYRRCNYA